MKYFNRSLVLGCSLLALSACGPDDIASPGNSSGVTVNISTPTPSPTPTPTGPATVTPAGTCPTITDPQGLTDKGTISGPTGTYRVCELPRTIKVSSTLPKVAGLLYSLNGRVDVGCDGGFSAPTTGAPYTSTTVGCSHAADQGHQRYAHDRAGRDPVRQHRPVLARGQSRQQDHGRRHGDGPDRLHQQGQRRRPQLGQLDRPVGRCRPARPGQDHRLQLRFGRHPDTCERDTEGAVDKAIFGGNDDNDNSGVIKYVQIRYSGFVLSADKELQSLTNEGVGSGTVIDYLQSHNSSDDGSETFGGNLGMSHYIVTGADDDSLDVDAGARLRVQHALLLQRPGQGDTFMEIDSNGKEDDTPRTRLVVANFTAVQPQASAQNDGSGDLAATMFRGNSDTTLVDGVIYAPNNECIRMNGSGTTPATLKAFSVVLTCNSTKYIGTGSFTAANVATAFGSGSNNNNDSLTSTLTSLFVNGANEDGVAVTDAATYNFAPLSSFFTTPTHIGAAYSGNTSWYSGWTCNSSYAPLGGGFGLYLAADHLIGRPARSRGQPDTGCPRPRIV